MGFLFERDVIPSIIHTHTYTSTVIKFVIPVVVIRSRSNKSEFTAFLPRQTFYNNHSRIL